MPRAGTPCPVLSDAERLRFNSKIARGEPDACWPWQGAKLAKGYGRFKVGGKLFSTHRIAYVLEHGEIPAKFVATGLILHGCHNPACCNPAHLRLGTGSDNVRDAIAAGRWTQGFRNKGRTYFGKNADLGLSVSPSLHGRRG